MVHALRQTRGRYLCHISDCSFLTHKSETFFPTLLPPQKKNSRFLDRKLMFSLGGSKTTFWAYEFNLYATESAVRLHVPSPYPPRTLQLIHTPSPIKIPLSSVHSLSNPSFCNTSLPFICQRDIQTVSGSVSPCPNQ